MPGFDRTGPVGNGSQTGRGLGKCNPKTKENTKTVTSENDNHEYGKRIGRGMGRRLGMENRRRLGKRS